MLVQIGGIDDCDMVNGGRGNIAHTIFLAGCNRGCPGCQNIELQPLDSGYSCTTNDIANEIYRNNLATCVVITGGEPMLQHMALSIIVVHAKIYNKKVWLYTSYELHEIPRHILRFCDVVKTGWYDKSKRIEDGVLATSNQQYYRKGVDGIWRQD